MHTSLHVFNSGYGYAACLTEVPWQTCIIAKRLFLTSAQAGVYLYLATGALPMAWGPGLLSLLCFKYPTSFFLPVCAKCRRYRTRTVFFYIYFFYIK